MCIPPTSRAQEPKIDPVRSGVLRRRRRWSRMILNNAKYEAERRRRCGKRKRKKIDGRMRRTKVEKPGGWSEYRRGEGYIGYADRRKGTSWWNNRSLARAIASARHCARPAARSTQWKRMNAGQRERCKRAFVLSPALRLSTPLFRDSRRKAKSAWLLILCPVSTTLRYVPVVIEICPPRRSCSSPLLLVFSLDSLFLGRSSYWNRVDPLSPFAEVAFGL